MFKKKLKFSEGAIKKKIKFAWKPTLIDGGTYKIWLRFYYELYKREEGYLNWDKKDLFKPIGSFSHQGSCQRFLNLKYKNPQIHWAENDEFKASFMKTEGEINQNNIQ